MDSQIFASDNTFSDSNCGQAEILTPEALVAALRQVDSAASGDGGEFEGEDSLFLTHGEMCYVREAASDDEPEGTAAAAGAEATHYVTLGAIGVEPFRFYKKGAQEFLGRLHRGFKSAEKLANYLKTVKGQVANTVLYESILQDKVDPKTDVQYQTRLTASVYKGVPMLDVRSYAFLPGEAYWQATKRGVRIAIDRAEVERIKAFINEKMKPVKRAASAPSEPKPTPLPFKVVVEDHEQSQRGEEETLFKN